MRRTRIAIEGAQFRRRGRHGRGDIVGATMIGLEGDRRTRLGSRKWTAKVALALMILTVIGCSTGPQSAERSGRVDAPAGAIEDCEDMTFVPCARQVAIVALPIAGSSLSLRYASDRTAGRKASPSLDAGSIGLGGWTLDVLHTFDPAAHVLILGTGERRPVDATSLNDAGTSSLAVGSVDGSEVYVFDTTGRHLHTFDAVTGAERHAFAWTPAGLDAITEPGERVTRVQRDATGGPSEIVTARGYRTRLGLLDGRLATVSDPSGHLTAITSNGDGLVTSIRDATNANTALRYDDVGRLVEWTGKDGTKLSLERKESDGGFTVATTTGEGRHWSDSVEHRDGKSVRTHRDAAGQSTVVEVSGAKRTITDADRTVTHLELTADPRWGMSAPVPHTTDLERSSGRRSTSSETRIADSASTPNAPGPVHRDLTVDGAIWSIASDPAAHSTTITAPDHISRTTVLDDNGRPVSLAVTGSAPLTYHYDSGGRIDAITAGTGTEARTWRQAYDLTTGTVTRTDPTGRATVVRADADGRPQSTTAPGDLTTEAERDESGRLTAVVPPAGAATRIKRLPGGGVDTVTQPTGAGGPQFSTFDYDHDGAMTASNEADGKGITVHRDANGRVDQVDAGAGPWRIGYDGTTGSATTFDGPGATLNRTYDGADLTSEKWSGPVDATVTHRLDAGGRMVAETVPGTNEIGYDYDAAGQLTKAGDVRVERDQTSGRTTAEVLGSLRRTWSYNTFGEVTAVAVTSDGRPMYDLAVDRDALGRVIARDERLPDGTKHRTFTYDRAGRLEATADNGAAATTFSYDTNGNLITEKAPDGTITRSSYDQRNALLARGDTTYTYDAGGRLATTTSPVGPTTYSYDRSGALLSVRPSAGPAIDYVNDATGRRIAKKVGGTAVQWLAYHDGLRPAAALDGSGRVTGQFVYGAPGSAPTYMVRDGKTLLIVDDDLGTPRLLIDAADGHVVEQLDTDAWGKVTADTALGTTPFGWTGGLADPDTGLVRLGARDYDPAARRWTATDPIGFQGGDTNLYRYVADDPVNRVDPTGLCDVETGSVSFSWSFANHSYSVGAGLALAGHQGTGYTYTGRGTGTLGAGVSLTLGCLFERDPYKAGSPFDDLKGDGYSGDIGVGPVNFGGDISGSPGNPSLFGPHYGVGVGLADGSESVQHTVTSVGCFFCEPGSFGPRDPGAGNGTGGSDSQTNLGASTSGLPPRVIGGVTQAIGRIAASWGEPHLRTVGGQNFDFQAVGEFTALRSDSGDLVVQTRQAPLGGTPAQGGSRAISINTGVAVNVNGDRLTFQFEDHTPVVRLNGQVIDHPSGAIVLPKGGRLETDGSYLVTWPDHTVLSVFPGPLDISLSPATGRIGSLHGLLGPDTGGETQGLEAKDGTTIPKEQLKDREAVHRRFGDSWRVSQAESLFDYQAGESTATFDDRNFPEAETPTVTDSQRAAAERLCKRSQLSDDALAACILDVSVSGDATWATAADAVLNTFGPTGPTPGSGGGTKNRVALGDTVSGSLANADAKDTYTLTAKPGEIVYFEHDTAACQVFVAISDASHEVVQGPACNDNGPWLLPTGEASINVFQRGAASGDYRFRLIAVPPTTNGHIEIGGTAEGRLETKGAVSDYAFSADAGQVVYFAHGVAACQMIATISDTGGDLIQGSACNDMAPVTLPKSGEYHVRISRRDAGTAEYRFRLLIR